MSRAIRTVRRTVFGLGAAAAVLLLPTTVAYADGPVPTPAVPPLPTPAAGKPVPGPVPTGTPAVTAVAPAVTPAATPGQPRPSAAPTGQVKVVPRGGAQTGEGRTDGPSAAALAGGSGLGLAGLAGVGYALRKRRAGAAG